jgi:hypothetical protein
MKRNEGVMRCSNPKCRCGLLDMPDGSIWLSQLEPPGNQPTWNGEGAFSVSTLPQKYFWHCAGALVRSFSGVGRDPVSFWLRDHRVQDTEKQGRSPHRPVRFRSTFMLALSSKRNSWMWDSSI